MTTFNSPVAILELGSTHINLAIYDNLILNQSLFYEEKIDYINNENIYIEQIVDNLILKAEKKLKQHLNEIILMVDTLSINSIYISQQKNYDRRLITINDLNHLINESETIVKRNYQEKEILHIVKSKIIFDDKIIQDAENLSQETSKVTLDLIFLVIDKKKSEYLKKLFKKKQIYVKKIFCTSYIKSLGLINKLGIFGINSFIDIGLKKSSLTIFKDNNLLYFNNLHIGGNHITKDIHKVLKIDYQKAESQKLKFSKNHNFDNNENNNDLLKQIINSRLEEIVELLFLYCPLIKSKALGNDINLFFTGNGSKVLNENLLSFGSEFSFINDMTIIKEESRDGCDSALKFNTEVKILKSQNQSINIENKGLFERFFEYFSKK